MGMIGNSLAQGLISGANIQDGTVDVADLKDGSVTSAKLDTNVSVDGSLTVDTDTLVVDDANNRVGVGTSAPDRPLSITDGTNDGTGGVKIASYLPVLEMDDISGGGNSFKIEHDQTTTSFKHDSTVRATLADNGVATFTGASGASEGNLRSTSSSGHSYIGVNRDTVGQGEVGYSWNTGGATKWWNYLAADSDEMRWYSNGANRMTLSQAGTLYADKLEGADASIGTATGSNPRFGYAQTGTTYGLKGNNTWNRVAFINHRASYEVTVYTTGGSFSPGSVTFHVQTSWQVALYAAVLSKLGTQYATQIRFTSAHAGGSGGYLEVYCIGSANAHIGLSIRTLHHSGWIETQSAPYGFNETALAHTTGTITL